MSVTVRFKARINPSYKFLQDTHGCPLSSVFYYYSPSSFEELSDKDSQHNKARSTPGDIQNEIPGKSDYVSA
jgi:hypothetical protein